VNFTVQFDPEHDKPVVFLEPVNNAERTQLQILAAFDEIRFNFELDEDEEEVLK
jgi:hypothetical protein